MAAAYSRTSRESHGYLPAGASMSEQYIRFRRQGTCSITPLISTDEWRHWELMRHLDQETGRHGYYGDEAAK